MYWRRNQVAGRLHDSPPGRGERWSITRISHHVLPVQTSTILKTAVTCQCRCVRQFCITSHFPFPHGRVKSPSIKMGLGSIRHVSSPFLYHFPFPLGGGNRRVSKWGLKVPCNCCNAPREACPSSHTPPQNEKKTRSRPPIDRFSLCSGPFLSPPPYYINPP